MTISKNGPVGLAPGLLLTFGLAGAAWFLGKLLPVIGSPVFGLFLGMLAALWPRPAFFRPGIQFSSKTLLKAAIILLGFGMNLGLVLQTGRDTILLMATTITITLLTGALLGSLLKVGRKPRILVSVGTCICGGSAIAACAPIIKANDEEIAASISTIFLFNVIAAFLFPALGHLMLMSDHAFGIWAGTAINDTSSVVAAAYAYSDQAGSLAVIVKLARTLVIIPLTLTLAFLETRRELASTSTVGPAEARPSAQLNDLTAPADSSVRRFSLASIFPWFVLGFLAAAAANSFWALPTELTKLLSQCGKFAIVMAMAAIGLNTHLGKLLRNGWRPILLGLGCWIILALSALGAQQLFM